MTVQRKREFSQPEISDELTILELTNTLFIANRELLNVNQKLKKSEEIRKQTFSNLSHDLRAPIASIIGHIEYLQISNELEKEILDTSLNHIKSKLFNISKMIDDMLYISLLDTTSDSYLELETSFQIKDLKEFIQNYYNGLLSDNRFNNRSLQLKIDESLHYSINIIPNQIIRVLDNLYSNALKYTDSTGNLILTVTCSEDHAFISLQDNGIGISKEYLNKIFERSFMISQARTPETETSCGLGLSIAKTIIIQHGGNIWATSEPNNGSTFTFSLPACQTINMNDI